MVREPAQWLQATQQREQSNMLAKRLTPILNVSDIQQSFRASALWMIAG
jgi:hypothetical protein